MWRTCVIGKTKIIVKDEIEVLRTQSKSITEALMWNGRMSRMNEKVHNVLRSSATQRQCRPGNPYDAQGKTCCCRYPTVRCPSPSFVLALLLITRKPCLQGMQRNTNSEGGPVVRGFWELNPPPPTLATALARRRNFPTAAGVWFIISNGGGPVRLLCRDGAPANRALLRNSNF